MAVMGEFYLMTNAAHVSKTLGKQGYNSVFVIPRAIGYQIPLEY